MSAPRVVVVGGGFAGLYAAQHLARANVALTLVDRRNFHLFQPLLYQVATGGLSPADVAAPLRAVLAGQRNARVLLAEATGIDARGRRLLLRDGALAYDALVLATGARHHYFGQPGWETLAPGLKTIEDATEIRRRVLSAFEAAELEPDPARRAACLTFVVVGAGPTGVELAGALAEIARDTLRGNFRTSDPSAARVVLVEGTERVLPSYPADLSEQARLALTRLGVEVRVGTLVSDVTPDTVVLRRDALVEPLAARVVLWAAGVQASPLGRALHEATGCPLDRQGRVRVEPDLSVPGQAEIFVAGDLAHARGADGQPLPGVAPVAMQQGRHVARAVVARLAGRPTRPFHYFHKGSLATIGRAAAVADFGRVRFGGYPAWLAWLFIHLMYLVEFENRLLVFVQWAWNYFTRNRSARLITHARWPTD